MIRQNKKYTDKLSHKGLKEEKLKDYALVYHLAKLTGTKVYKKKDKINCTYPFDEKADIDLLVFFKGGKSESALYDLCNVHYHYGKAKFASYEDMLNAIVKKYSFFKIFEYENNKLLSINLVQNSVKHVASSALSSLSVLVMILNEMLGTKAECFSEEDWRDLHRDLLLKQKKRNALLSGGSVLLSVLGIALFVLSGGTGLLLLLGLFCVPVGIIAAIFFGLLYKIKARQLNKSVQSKKFNS